MTDDKAISGRQIPDRDEAIATLFYAFYPKLVRTGYGYLETIPAPSPLATARWLQRAVATTLSPIASGTSVPVFRVSPMGGLLPQDERQAALQEAG